MLGEGISLINFFILVPNNCPAGLNFCSNLIYITMIKYSDQKQFREEGIVVVWMRMVLCLNA